MKTLTSSKFKWFRIRFWATAEQEMNDAWAVAFPLIYGGSGPVDDDSWCGVSILFVWWAAGVEILPPK